MLAKLAALLCLFVACFFQTSEAVWGMGTRLNETCYENVGCFSIVAPFHKLPKPEDPNKYKPQFYLYRKNDHTFTAINDASEFNALKGVTVITHGFRSSLENCEDWAKQYAENLVKRGDVLFYEWKVGAKMRLLKGRHLYRQAASNTRTSGAYMAKFLQQNDLFRASVSHCIGHSLGSHVCAFAGKTLRADTGKPWDRITGLDAAGPGFEGKPAEARLDKSDATFVQDIHTSSQWGLKMPVGHVDFYVNGNETQPGCIKHCVFSLASSAVCALSEALYVGQDGLPALASLPLAMPLSVANMAVKDYNAASTLVACSHMRVMEIVGGTFNPKPGCSYKFCKCPSLDFKQPSCQACTDENSNQVGMLVNRNKQGIFYAKTTGVDPYCVNE